MRKNAIGKQKKSALSRRKKRGLRRRRVGSLTIIAVVFGLSGVARVSGSYTSPISENWMAIAAWANASESASVMDDPDERQSADVLFDALLEREQRLVEQERALEEREYALRLAQQELRTSMDAFEAAEASLRQMVTLADGAAQADLDRLTRMYETMKPKDAAALFETMDLAFAAGFLGQMSPASAAEILSGLSPEVAYGVSLVLAGRNVNPETN